MELNVSLRPSLQLATFIVVSHLLALVAVWFSVLPWSLCLAVGVAVLGNLCWQWRRHYRVGHRFLRHGESGWWLVDAEGEHSLQLAGEYLVTPWLLVLRFKGSAGFVTTLVLPPDSAAPDDLRRLRVLLRFGLRSEEVA